MRGKDYKKILQIVSQNINEGIYLSVKLGREK
jgi:hypothetical protein